MQSVFFLLILYFFLHVNYVFSNRYHANFDVFSFFHCSGPFVLIGFERTAIAVAEDVGVECVCVEITHPLAQTITADVASIDGSAVSMGRCI